MKLRGRIQYYSNFVGYLTRFAAFDILLFDQRSVPAQAKAPKCPQKAPKRREITLDIIQNLANIAERGLQGFGTVRGVRSRASQK